METQVKQRLQQSGFNTDASNLVLAEQPKQQVYRYEQPEVMNLPPSNAQVHTQLKTTYVDKAKAFQIATVPLGVAVGVGAALMAFLLGGYPAFSTVTFIVFWTGFLFTWLIGWIVHNLFSSDGVALTHTLLGWIFLYKEQSVRHKYMDRGE